MKSELLFRSCKGVLTVFLGLYCFSCTLSDFVWAGNDTEVVDRIVAIVNDDIIVLSELNGKMKPYTGRISKMGYPPEKERKMIFKVREDIINTMVDQKLTDQEVKKFGIRIDDEEILSTIERIKQKNSLTEEQMQADLARQGITIETIKKNIRVQMLRARLLNVAVKSKIVVTREDARVYFESHLEEFRGEKEVHLKNIMTTTPEFAFQAEMEAGRGYMEKVLARLESGESFDVVARELASKKGPLITNDIGMFKLGVLSPELQDAVGGLKEGQHTGLLDTDNGYQIFYVHKIVAGPGKQFEEVMPEIQEKLFNEQVDRRFEKWLSDLREKSHIQIIR